MNRNALEDRLLDYLYGDMTSQERGAYEQALDGHPDIRERVRSYQGIREAARAVELPDPPQAALRNVLLAAREHAVELREAHERVRGFGGFFGRLSALLMRPAMATALVFVVVLATGVLLVQRAGDETLLGGSAEPASPTMVPPPAATATANPSAAETGGWEEAKALGGEQAVGDGGLIRRRERAEEATAAKDLDDRGAASEPSADAFTRSTTAPSVDGTKAAPAGPAPGMAGEPGTGMQPGGQQKVLAGGTDVPPSRGAARRQRQSGGAVDLDGADGDASLRTAKKAAERRPKVLDTKAGAAKKTAREKLEVPVAEARAGDGRADLAADSPNPMKEPQPAPRAATGGGSGSAGGLAAQLAPETAALVHGEPRPFPETQTERVRSSYEPTVPAADPSVADLEQVRKEEPGARPDARPQDGAPPPVAVRAVAAQKTDEAEDDQTREEEKPADPAKDLFAQGDAAFEAGRYPEAAEAFRRYLAVDRSSPRAGVALVRLGQAYQAQGLLNQALGAYEEALLRHPRYQLDPALLYQTASLQVRLGKLGPAEGNLVRIEKDPTWGTRARDLLDVVRSRQDEDGGAERAAPRKAATGKAEKKTAKPAAKTAPADEADVPAESLPTKGD